MDARTFGFDRPVAEAESRRAMPRVPAVMCARLRDRFSNKYDIHVLDLSITGFRADAHYGLDAGHFVWLTIPGMQGLEATVAWRRGTVIGAQFKQPLYPAVLDHIVKTIRR